MIIFKITNEDGILTYTFNDDSHHGKTGNLGIGVSIFIGAMKKQYYNHPLKTTLTIMNDRGEYYHESGNKYLHVVNNLVPMIVLSFGR